MSDFVENDVDFVFVGNKAKSRISKRVLQEKKGRQKLRKTNISYPFTHTNLCISGGTK